MRIFKKGKRVLLSTEGLKDSAFINLDASKLAPRFTGPFKVLKAIVDATGDFFIVITPHDALRRVT